VATEAKSKIAGNLKLYSGVVTLLTGLVLTACAPSFKMQPSTVNQADCGFVQNVYGERISWKNSGVIPLQIHESVPTEMQAALERAIKVWEDAVGRPLFTISQTQTKTANVSRRDGVNTIYWLNTWEDDRASEQARTAIYWEGDVIKEADIRINAKDYTFYDQFATSDRDVHLESLMVHELGHILGLKHQDSSGSVMATTLASQMVRNKISNKDVESIRCEY
jgi:predicted Zn-dependent protease